MKLNKLISKGLAFGIILNSISVISYANTEIPNRYQTLEGEYIAIDDSTEGNLEEIEIFGNTVQDENNLEDIQSVGDLYVDEDGNPILDKQGREQYKIDIISTNKNLFDLKSFVDAVGGSYIGNEYNSMGSKTNSKFMINIPKGFTISYIATPGNIGDRSASSFALIRKDGSLYHRAIGSGFLQFTTTEDYIGIQIVNYHLNWKFENFQIEKGNKSTPYIHHESNKVTILLPCQLQKVGDVADKIYWDNSKGRYVIEKNIKKDIFNYNKSKNGIFVFTTSYGYMTRINFGISDNIKYDYGIQCISNKILSSDQYDSNTGGLHGGVKRGLEIIGAFFATRNELRIDKGYDGVENDIDAIRQERINELKEMGDLIIYQTLETPQIIKTNITSKLKMPTYDEKTHIYVDSENGINPTLKFIVDRLPQIAKEAVAQAESDNTNHNISLARRYINMLPESSYKDQLQNQLSDIFSSDMVLDRKIATSNLDVYIKSENILQMSLDTNSISFDDFSGIEDVVKENAVNITINSSLPYQINAYLPNEIQNADKTKTLDKSILNIKENSESEYKEFANINEKVILKDNCSSGNYLTHGVDLKLAGGIAHEKDVYKAVIKLEAEQK